MKKILISAFVVIVGICAYADEIRTELVCPEYLFSISKSTNSNVLYYAPSFRQGMLDHRNPVQAFWIMYEERGQRANLSFFERSQLGVNTTEIVRGELYHMNVRARAISHRTITVGFGDDGCVRATAEIGGITAYVDTVYVNIDPDSGFIPRVLYIDLFGTDVDTGEEVIERIYN